MAIWRRIWLFPFNETIGEDERDPNIMDKLSLEGSGILNWLLDGLSRYLERGHLSPPEKVLAATSRYRIDQDVLGQFIRDEMTLSTNATISRSTFYQVYRQWCEAEGEKPMGAKRVVQYMREKGIREQWFGGLRSWSGLRIKTLKERQEFVDAVDHQGVLV
jgi:putative DNA primase/helicase